MKCKSVGALETTIMGQMPAFELSDLTESAGH